MEARTLIPLEKYAAMKKMSLYQVLQKVKKEELQSEVVAAEGKKTTYIVLREADAADAPAAVPAAESGVPQEPVDYKAAYEALKKEFEAYKRKCEGASDA